ncbi:MAG: glycosyltransferase family 4 protein [Mangrovibacterium sp.]
MQHPTELAYHLLVPLAAIVSFMVVFTSIPTVLHIAYSKRLFDKPNFRSAHTKITPRLGGIAIAFGFIFTYSFFADWYSYAYVPFLTSSFVLIFVVGIKDDIISTAAVVKLLGQLLAASIIVGLGGVQIDELQGVLSVPLSEGWGIAISIFAVTFLLNGFNLIDGIDGLAAITGIISLSAFTLWFYINGYYHIPLIAASLAGGLLAFIYYNMYCVRLKIFMGDTGSLLIGFVVSVVAIAFLKFNNQIVNVEPHTYTLSSAPAVAVAVLIVPVVDTIRIFFLRILRGNSPFSPDKNHIHHRMLELGMTHHQISFTIGGVNVFFIFLAYFLRDIGTWALLAIVLPLGFALAATPSWILLFKKKNKQKQASKLQAAGSK